MLLIPVSIRRILQKVLVRLTIKSNYSIDQTLVEGNTRVNFTCNISRSRLLEEEQSIKKFEVFDHDENESPQ